MKRTQEREKCLSCEKPPKSNERKLPSCLSLEQNGRLCMVRPPLNSANSSFPQCPVPCWKHSAAESSAGRSEAWDHPPSNDRYFLPIPDHLHRNMAQYDYWTIRKSTVKGSNNGRDFQNEQWQTTMVEILKINSDSGSHRLLMSAKLEHFITHNDNFI